MHGRHGGGGRAREKIRDGVLFTGQVLNGEAVFIEQLLEVIKPLRLLPIEMFNWFVV